MQWKVSVTRVSRHCTKVHERVCRVEDTIFHYILEHGNQPPLIIAARIPQRQRTAAFCGVMENKQGKYRAYTAPPLLPHVVSFDSLPLFHVSLSPSTSLCLFFSTSLIERFKVDFMRNSLAIS